MLSLCNGQTVARNDAPAAECLRVSRAGRERGSETHSSGRKDPSEISALRPWLGGRDLLLRSAGIGSEGTCAAEALKLALLQHAKQFGLKGHRIGTFSRS